jgi:hypothetical protein
LSFFINGQKTALTLRQFLATFAISHKWAKNSKKVKLFIALNFLRFLATFAIFYKWAKNSKKVRL